jgi:hypothetical protein
VTRLGAAPPLAPAAPAPASRGRACVHQHQGAPRRTCAVRSFTGDWANVSGPVDRQSQHHRSIVDLRASIPRVEQQAVPSSAVPVNAGRAGGHTQRLPALSTSAFPAPTQPRHRSHLSRHLSSSRHGLPRYTALALSFVLLR